MNHLHTQLNIAKTDDHGAFSGYASIFDVTDAHHDIIKPGAFRQSIEEMERKNRMPKMLWQHQHAVPIGVWTFMEEDARGLYVEGKLLTDIQQAKDAYVLLKGKAIEGLSIGYTVAQAYKNPQGGRTLTQIHLHEISIVTFASNVHAQVMGVKGGAVTG